MKSKSILRKALSVFMTLIMAFSVMAVGVNAEDTCTCTAKCTTEDNKNTECLVCNNDYSACEYIQPTCTCTAKCTTEENKNTECPVCNMEF